MKPNKEYLTITFHVEPRKRYYSFEELPFRKRLGMYLLWPVLYLLQSEPEVSFTVHREEENPNL